MSAYNGSGTFVISGTGLPFVTGTTISSTVANQLNTDLATGLSTALTKDGQTTPTANIKLGGFKLTGVGPATTAGDAVTYITPTTWTPTDASGASLSFTVNSSRQCQIGSVVFLWATITYPVTANGSSAKIGGLPVAFPNVTQGATGMFSIAGQGGIPLYGYPDQNAATFTIRDSTSANVTNASLSGAVIRFNFAYPVA